MALLSELVFASLPTQHKAWLEERWPIDADRASLRPLQVVFAAMGRRLANMALPDAQREQLARTTLQDAAAWDLTTLARVALLIQALDHAPAASHPALIRALYVRGDSTEQSAVLRALPLLPQPQRFVALGVEACRTNVADVFAAFACRNPFAARYLPDANFNQMVLKSIFIGLDTQCIDGLSSRVTEELKRMLADYADERSAAHRSVPADVARILAMQSQPARSPRDGEPG
jgi:hypothetical protein